MKRVTVLLMATLLIGIITGCGRKAVTSQDDIKIAILAPGASDFWSRVKVGADKAAKDFNVTCNVIAPSQGGEQSSRLEDLLAKGVSGISLAPSDPANQIDDINKAAAKVNLVTTDTDAPKSKRLCYIGTDNLAAGKMAGGLLKKALPEGGKVWICVGMLDMQNARDRYQGVCDAVKGTNIQILGVLVDNGDPVKAKANVEDALVKTPDIAAFVGLWSYNGPAIADVVKYSGKAGKVKIVCFDEDDATLQGLRDGLIFASVVQRPFEFGYQSVRVLAALARKQKVEIPPSKIIDTGTMIVDKSNVDQFVADMKKSLSSTPSSTPADTK